MSYYYTLSHTVYLFIFVLLIMAYNYNGPTNMFNVDCYINTRDHLVVEIDQG